MKIAVVFAVLVPLAFGASVDVDRRFLESVFGGVDVLNLAKQVLSTFGCDETEAQCESTMCPNILNPIDHNNQLITGIVCTAVCKEAQILAKHYTSGHGTTPSGVDPCAGGLGGGLIPGK